MVKLAFTSSSSLTFHRALLPYFNRYSSNLSSSRVMSGVTSLQMIQPPPATGKGSNEGGQVRVRQHLNPLARRWSQPVVLPENWYATAFKDVSLPLIVDVGVAKGRFLLQLAARDKSFNYLGLEIREPLVHQANRCAINQNVSNLFYISCNANVSLARVLNDAPSGVLQDVFVQFCDPWFKKRHVKRRMVNPPLVDAIYQALWKSRCERVKADAGPFREPSVFVQTDVLEVACQMREIFDLHGGFLRVSRLVGLRESADGWLLENPIGVPTEREIAVQKKDGAVYRALYQLKNVEPKG